LPSFNFSEAVYGFGAGIFFIGYFIFEVPSNLIMHRVGAKIWMARIMITWGIISALMAFTGVFATKLGVSNIVMFYSLRFLLGVAEAGFFPGMILYFNYWYPAHRHGKIVALMLSAQPVAFIFGGPLSGWVMDAFNGVGAMRGWQWMFLMEGIPAAVVGVVIIFYLSNGIKDSRWLTADEKSVLIHRVESEKKFKSDYPLSQLFKIRMLYVFIGITFMNVIGIYGLNFWIPSIIKAAGVTTNFKVGLITAIPYFVGAVAMLLVSLRSERVNEKRWHTSVAAAIGGLGLIGSAYFTGNIVVTMTFITIGLAGCLATNAMIWSFPGSILTGSAAAAGIATINSLGALGGFFGPSLLGVLTDMFGNRTAGLAVLGCCEFVAALLIAVFCGSYGIQRDSSKVSTA
jgi:MFS family permease